MTTYLSNLIIISGLPGSGKTTYAKELPSYTLIDDPKEKPVIEPHGKYVITDPKLCYRRVFDKVNALYPEAFWLFFRPNGLLAWMNVQKRLEKEPEKVISHTSFLKFVIEYTENFDYYLSQVNAYGIREVYNGLV